MSRNPPSRALTNSNRSVGQQLFHNATGASEFHQHTTSLSSPDDGFGLFFQSNEKEMSNVLVTFEAPLPVWLQGTFVRNGLGLFEKGPRSFLHAFDGFAKLASWKFMGNESALFSTRFLRSMFYKSSMDANTITPYLLFQSVDPPFGYIEKLQCLFRGIDNMNVNIVAFRNPKNKLTEYAALSDFWIVYKVTIDKLSTKHRVIPKVTKSRKSSVSNLDSTGFLNLLSSSHPLPEPGTKNHLNFLSSVAVLPWGNSMMNLMRIKSLKRRSVVAQWPVDRVPYMHSFSVTRSKAILLASPFYVNVMCMARKAEPFSCLDWYPNDPSKLYIVDLKSGNVTKITVNNIFTMHHVNAYDLDNNSIIMDVSSYPSPEFVSHLQLHVLRDPVKRNSFAAHAQLKRIFIDLIKNEAREIPLDQSAPPRLASLLDMPVINEAYRSKHYCFVYGLVLKADNKTLSNIAVVKKDVCHDGQGDRIWQLGGHYPVEPWFVADPQGIDEDDGLLLVAVLDGERKQTYLIVLDARTLTLTNRAVMPTNIPYSLHGRFFPGV
ncbi:unnamed protein product [Candidula unifasciata]|uniref:Uncharacterized protein n=1 Tax=Candidula unifasciata TaxID=100452 RepID=A0A8S3ZIU4_9EUPU|nr:unnamed protein product [Candidula unifasciata]